MKQGWRRAVGVLTMLVAATGGALALEDDPVLTPPPGAPVGPGPGLFTSPGAGFGLMGGTSMLLMPAVQSELKLTGAQKTSVETLLRRLRDEQGGFFHQLGQIAPEERGRRLAERRTTEEKQVNALLTPEQQRRFRQIQLQQQGLAALLDPPVAAELKLTDAQRVSIQAAFREQDAAMGALLHPGPAGFEPQSLQRKLEAAQKACQEKTMAALTGEQQRQWRALLGPPFRLPAAGALFLSPGGDTGPEALPLSVEPPSVTSAPG